MTLGEWNPETIVPLFTPMLLDEVIVDRREGVKILVVLLSRAIMHACES